MAKKSLRVQVAELQARIDSIKELTEHHLQRSEVLASSKEVFDSIVHICNKTEDKIELKINKKEKLDHIVISCDASITKNPGGTASIGYVIQYRDEKPILHAKIVSAKSNNEAEYDAVYEALTHLFSIKNNPGCLVEVR